MSQINQVVIPGNQAAFAFVRALQTVEIKFWALQTDEIKFFNTVHPFHCACDHLYTPTHAHK
jgi:hypothetical protein